MGSTSPFNPIVMATWQFTTNAQTVWVLQPNR
jgi:hypothetical protein